MCQEEVDYKLAEQTFNKNKAVVPFVYNRWFSKYPAYQEDLFQEGYGALWKACCEFRDEGKVKFSTYMINSVYYKMLYYVRKVICKHSHVVSLESTIVSETAEGDSLFLIDILHTEDNLDAKYLIEVCMEKLDSEDREIIKDIFVGYTEQEVAARHNVSQATISRRLIYFRNLINEEKNR